TANVEVQQAESALLVAKNSEHRTGARAVRDAQANLDSARDRRDYACDPAVVQKAGTARAPTNAADDARRQAALDKAANARNLTPSPTPMNSIAAGSPSRTSTDSAPYMC